MAKKCVFVEASISPAELCDPIDWSRCILCQRVTRDKLVCPGRSIGQNKDAGYESLADILPEFESSVCCRLIYSHCLVPLILRLTFTLHSEHTRPSGIRVAEITSALVNWLVSRLS